MQKLGFEEALDVILARDDRYDADAYRFLREVLDFAVKEIKKESQSSGKHVTGGELLEGLRDYALDQFGPMARTILQHWGVGRGEDVGEMVFNLIEVGVFGRTESDSKEDFANRFDFEEAFEHPFLPASRIARIRAEREKPGIPTEPGS